MVSAAQGLPKREISVPPFLSLRPSLQLRQHFCCYQHQGSSQQKACSNLVFWFSLPSPTAPPWELPSMSLLVGSPLVLGRSEFPTGKWDG